MILEMEKDVVVLHTDCLILIESKLLLPTINSHGLRRKCLRNTVFCLFVLRHNVPVNNYSVLSGRSHRFLGISRTFGG